MPLDRLRRSLPCEDRVWSGEGAQAAVLVALTDEAEPRVVLGRRAGHLRLHPGEVAFPGGKREPVDRSPFETAKREAWEEVQINPDEVLLLGELSSLTTRTGYEVYPCVAAVPAAPELVVDPQEFESAFLLPISVFANSDLYRLEHVSDGRGSVMVPHYEVGRDNIWGVTAYILAQLANIALAAELDIPKRQADER
ncbi:MAG: CoA pyrophosphatase [Halieaceae bacterium]|jgi:8-oxo-dGTP pyrophosphatase MutT (NUDIX family)|nr:CoA pyrophosphatase [Halieaceae bacterium]